MTAKEPIRELAACDDDADAVIEGLRKRVETAEAANCRMREALTVTLGDLQTVQAACALGGLPPRAWAGFGGSAKKALSASGPCQHEKELAEARRMCGEAAKRLVHFEDYLEDEALVAELRAFEKGGNG